MSQTQSSPVNTPTRSTRELFGTSEDSEAVKMEKEKTKQMETAERTAALEIERLKLQLELKRMEKGL